MPFFVFGSVRKIDFVVGKVVDGDLKVSGVEAGDDLSHCHFSSDKSVVFGQQFCQSFVVGRAKPVHSVVNCIIDSGMPVFFGKGVGVPNDVADRVTVLETSKLAFSISNSKDQVASPFGCLHSVDRLV